MGKTTPKVPFFKDSGRCPKILEYTLRTLRLVLSQKKEKTVSLSHVIFHGFKKHLQEDGFPIFF